MEWQQRSVVEAERVVVPADGGDRLPEDELVALEKGDGGGIAGD